MLTKMFHLVILVWFLISNANSSELKEIKVGVGFLRPEGKELGPLKHFELEITKVIFKKMGLRPQFVYCELVEIPKKIISGEVEAALTLKTGLAGGIYYSDDYIVYQNVALALKESKIKIEGIKDLGKYSVTAFQNANRYLGSQYREVVRKHQNYIEYLEQKVQVDKFVNKQFNVFVGDYEIFKFHLKELGNSIDEKNIEVFRIFSPSNYKMGFLNKELRDNYNIQLEKVKESGDYLRIQQKSIEITSKN